MKTARHEGDLGDAVQAGLASLGVHDIPRLCGYSGCVSQLPSRHGRGRPAMYCSATCRDANDRDRRAIRRAQQRAAEHLPDTAAGQAVRTHLRLLAAQYGLDTADTTRTPPSTPTPQSWKAPPTTLNLHWFKDRQYTVLTEPFRLPFELYAALRDAEAVSKTAGKSIRIVLEHEKRQPSIKREPLYRMAKILDRFVSIIEQMSRIVLIPDRGTYEGLMLDTFDEQELEFSEHEWLARQMERSWYVTLDKSTPPWPVPEGLSLSEVMHENRAAYAARNMDVADLVREDEKFWSSLSK